MRTPKEVITALLNQVTSDPFIETIEDLDKTIVRARLKVEKANVELEQLLELREHKQNYHQEIANTKEYLKELK